MKNPENLYKSTALPLDNYSLPGTIDPASEMARLIVPGWRIVMSGWCTSKKAVQAKDQPAGQELQPDAAVGSGTPKE